MTNEEFNRIIDRYLAGQATAAETRLMEAFFESIERKQDAPDAVASEAIWQEIAVSISGPDPEPEPEPVIKRNHWRSMALVAGSLMVACALGYLGYYMLQSSASEMITKSAPYGEKVIVALTDGSKVILNSGSSIAFPRVFDDSQREINLQGEAFFEVTRSENQPFIVHTGELSTRVLGTSFNIQAFDENAISVTVATGRVQVFQDPAHRSDSGEPLESVFLDPSQQVIYQNHRFTVNRVDLAKSIAWKDDILEFDDASLSSVVSTLERWYDIDIVFENDEIVHCRINGRFKGQRLEEVLRSIRYMYNIDYEILTPNKITLYGKGCKK